MDETRLVAAAQKGKVDAFNELVLAYQQQVYNLALRIMGDPAAATDATQEAVIRAFRSLDRFRGGSFKAYLTRIVTNVCYDCLRAHKRNPAVSFEDLKADDEAIPALVSSEPSPEEHLEWQDVSQVIQAGIQSLPPDQRIVLVLCDVQGLSYQEIADAAGIPIGTVRSRLARGRAKLRDFLLAQGELLPPEYRLAYER